MEKANEIITLLLQVLNQARFDGVPVDGMRQVVGIQNMATNYLREQAPEKEEDGDVSGAAESSEDSTE